MFNCRFVTSVSPKERDPASRVQSVCNEFLNMDGQRYTITATHSMRKVCRGSIDVVWRAGI
jgi:hypothetical protein